MPSSDESVYVVPLLLQNSWNGSGGVHGLGDQPVLSPQPVPGF